MEEIKNENKKFNEVNFLYVLKAFAILLVACCHALSYYLTDRGALGYVIKVIEILGKAGVAIFFFVSGYLLKYNKKSFGRFFLNKVFTILIPWLITGTAVYLYAFLRHGGVSIISYIKFMIGLDAYLWFLPVMLFLQLVWLLFGKYKIMAIILPCLTAASYLVVHLCFHGHLNGFDYLNPFTWFLLFGVGYLFNTYRLLEKVALVLKKFFYIPIILTIGYVFIIVWFNLGYAYWDPYYPLLSILILASVIGVSGYIQNVKVIRYVGEVSFSVYLLHMPIAGIIANLSRRISSLILVPFAPIVCLAITVFAIWVYQLIIRKLGIEKWGGMLIGLRAPKKIIKAESE